MAQGKRWNWRSDGGKRRRKEKVRARKERASESGENEAFFIDQRAKRREKRRGYKRRRSKRRRSKEHRGGEDMNHPDDKERYGEGRESIHDQLILLFSPSGIPAHLFLDSSPLG